MSRRNKAMRRCRCGNPIKDGFLCTSCTKELAADLANLPHRIIELEETAYRLDRIAGAGAGGGKGKVRPLPFRPEIAEVLDRIRNEVTTWARDTCEHRGLDTGRLPTSTAALCDWLARHVESIRLSPQAIAMQAEFDRLHTEVSELVDLPPSPVYLGACDTKGCGRAMYAQRGDHEHFCRHCLTRYDVAQRQAQLLERSRGVVALASTISTALTTLDTPMTEDKIRRWREGGKLAVIKHDVRGRPMYRLGDVLDLVEFERQRAEAAAARRATRKSVAS